VEPRLPVGAAERQNAAPAVVRYGNRIVREIHGRIGRNRETQSQERRGWRGPGGAICQPAGCQNGDGSDRPRQKRASRGRKRDRWLLGYLGRLGFVENETRISDITEAQLGIFAQAALDELANAR